MTLSARTAALEGPDRAVDAEVFIAAFYPDWRIQTSCEPYPEQVQPGRIQEPNGCAWRNAPAFTASLDAAMSVFLEKPDMVPSCPIRCLSAALIERGL